MDDTTYPRKLQYKGATYRYRPLTSDQIAAIGMVEGSTPAYTLKIFRALGTHAIGGDAWQRLVLRMAAAELTVKDLMGLLLKVAEKGSQDEDALAEADED